MPSLRAGRAAAEESAALGRRERADPAAMELPAAPPAAERRRAAGFRRDTERRHVLPSRSSRMPRAGRSVGASTDLPARARRRKVSAIEYPKDGSTRAARTRDQLTKVRRWDDVFSGQIAQTANR